MRCLARRGPGDRCPVLLNAAYSQAFEEGEELIRRLVPAWGGSRRRGLGDRLLLDAEVGMEVDAVGSADVLVSQPERDGRAVNTMAKQVHGAGVPERVRGDVLGGQ